MLLAVGKRSVWLHVPGTINHTLASLMSVFIELNTPFLKKYNTLLKIKSHVF